MDSPQLLVCGGPNGAGMTTLAHACALEMGFEYLGADEIAERIAPGNAVDARIEAGRLFLSAIERNLAARQSIIVETTLSDLTFRNAILTARSQGFEISVTYVFLDTADACVARVKERVRKGGHHVPEADVRRRFSRSSVNFWNVYRKMADNWVLLDNGLGQLQDVAAGALEDISVRDSSLFSQFMSILGVANDN
jgi:predicted ABC-type ATPase